MEVLHFFAPCLAYRGMVCLSIIVALFVCGTFYFVVKYGSGRPTERRGLVAGCTALLLFPLVMAAVVQLEVALTSAEGHGVSAEVANQSLAWFKLPATAHDIHFKHSSGVGDEAEFAIEQADFIQWAQEEGWQPHVFQRDPDWPMPQDASQFVVPREMKFGFYFSNARLSGYFDHDTGRAKVWLLMD